MSLATSLASGFGSVKGKISDNKGPICLIAGNVLSIAGFALAFRSGNKVVNAIEARKIDCKAFKEIYDHYEPSNEGDNYDEKAYKKDIRKTNKRCVITVAKESAPALVSFILGQVLQNKAYSVVNKKYKAAEAFGMAMATAFAGYRKNVRDELGDNMDKHFLYGISSEEKDVTLVTKDEDGNEVETQEKCYVVENPLGVSGYAMWWTPETTTKYQSDEYYFKSFIYNTEKYFNDTLVCRKKLTLNEIKSYLGAKAKYRTLKGQAAGWKDGDTIKISIIKAARPIGNGKYEPAFIVDFNCHYILDEYPDTEFSESELGDEGWIEPEIL